MNRFQNSYKKNEWILYLLIFILGWIYSYAFLAQKTISIFFYRGFHTQAVSYGCGGPLKQPNEHLDAIYKFLNDDNETFDCSFLKNATYAATLGPREHSTHYMDEYWGTIWRVTKKISWQSIKVAMALFGGLLLIPTFGLFRLAFSIPIAIFLTCIAASTGSNFHTIYLYSDYPNGVWVLLTLFFITLMVVKDSDLSLTKKIILAFLAGATIGIGLGFRSSILPAIPFSLVSILLFSSQAKKILKIPLIFIFLLGYIATGFPHFINYQNQYRTSWYSLTAGRSLNYVRAMHLTKPFFRFNYQEGANDLLSSTLARTHGARKKILPLDLLDFAKQWGSDGGGEEKSGKSLHMLFNKEFPADWVMAAISSILHTWMPSSYTAPDHASVKWKPIFYPLRAVWMEKLDVIVPIFTLISLLLIFCYSLRIGFYSLFTLLFFGMLPSLYYDVRHFYHLQVIPIASCFFLFSRHKFKFNFLGALIFLISLTSIFLSYKLLAYYQNVNGIRFVEKYLQAKQTPLEITSLKKLNEHEVLYQFKDISDNPNFNQQTPWYMLKWTLIRFDLDFSLPGCCQEKKCELEEIHLDFKGYNPYPYEGYSHKQTYLFNYVKNYSATIFFPIHDAAYSRFQGLRIDNKLMNCLHNFARVDDTNLPFLIDLILPSNWREKDKTISIDFKNKSWQHWFMEPSGDR